MSTWRTVKWALGFAFLAIGAFGLMGILLYNLEASVVSLAAVAFGSTIIAKAESNE